MRTEAEGEGEASEKDKGKDKPASITVQSGWGGKATFASVSSLLFPSYMSITLAADDDFSIP